MNYIDEMNRNALFLHTRISHTLKTIEKTNCHKQVTHHSSSGKKKRKKALPFYGTIIKQK